MDYKQQQNNKTTKNNIGHTVTHNRDKTREEEKNGIQQIKIYQLPKICIFF